jgi:hypothetical protein
LEATVIDGCPGGQIQGAAFRQLIVESATQELVQPIFAKRSDDPGGRSLILQPE